MILTKNPATDKQQREFELLLSIRFACLMAQTEHPMQDGRVQLRLEKLRHTLFQKNPTHTFASQYLGRFGELGQTFALKVCPQSLMPTVIRIDPSQHGNLVAI